MLHPVLELFQTRLPLELREKVYKNLLNFTTPIVIPRTEHSDPALHSHSQETGQLRTGDLNPFRNDYYFNHSVMGPQTSTEIQELALRKTPFYFSGSKDAPDIKDFLDIQLQNGKHTRNLIQHLRMYLRCQVFAGDAVYKQIPNPSNMNHASFPIALGEETRNTLYASRLNGLQTLNYAKHKLTPEVCVFYNAAVLQKHDNRHIKRNLFECVKSVYYYAKDAGADMQVRGRTGQCVMSGRKRSGQWYIYCLLF
jgi:hypothetical protein